MVEHLDIEPEIAVPVCGQHLFAEKVVEFRLAVGGQAHYLPLVAGEHVEADVVRHRRVELAQAVGQLYAFQHLELVSAATGKHRRRFLAGAVPSQDRGRLERRNEECRWRRASDGARENET